MKQSRRAALPNEKIHSPKEITEDKDRSIDFKLEHYKYILQQIHSLNENTQRFLALYQTLVTAILGAGVALFVYWSSSSISASIAVLGIRCLLGLLVILTMFVIVSILSGVFSWLDYRKEEAKILNEIVGLGYRGLPKFRNLWRWYETYLVLFIIIIAIVVCIFVESQVIPLIK